MDKQQEKKPKKDAANRKKSSTGTTNLSPKKKKLLELEANPPPEYVLEKVEQDLPYQIGGTKIYALNDAVDREIEGNFGKKFAIGDIVKGRADNYKVREVLGRRTYVVKSLTSGILYVMKTEATLLPLAGPILKREQLFHLNACENLTPLQRSHFLTFIDKSALIPGQKGVFSATFFTKAKYSLAEVRAKRLNGREFSTQTAIRLCMMTLQCIYDVHFNRYVHRDIQPKNFFVGSGADDKNGVSPILISGMSYSLDILDRDPKNKGINSATKVANTSHLSSVFQPRDYHRRANLTTFSNDLESWIYMCYDFFNSKALPWNRPKKLSQQEYFNQKESFFLCAYDYEYHKLRIPPLLHVLRRKVFFLKPGKFVNHSFFAYTIMQMAKLYNVDWESMYEWQDEYIKAHESKDKTDETTTGTVESGSPPTREKPSPAKKPCKGLTLIQPQSVDTNDEAFKPIRLQTNPLKNGQKSKPVVAKKSSDDEKVNDKAKAAEPLSKPVAKKSSDEKVDDKAVAKPSDESPSKPVIAKKSSDEKVNDKAEEIAGESPAKPVIAKKSSDEKVKEKTDDEEEGESDADEPKKDNKAAEPDVAKPLEKPEAAKQSEAVKQSDYYELPKP